MESRKIQLVGNRSYSVSLPKDWVLSNNLREKDSVFISSNSSNELVISSTNIKKKQDKSISVNLEDIRNISEFLMFCYVKNIDNINLITNKRDLEKIKSIKGILRFLEGYDITYEGPKKIGISFLFNDININLHKILGRMTYSLRVLLSALESKDLHSLEDTETSLDRLFHLSRRILFSCARDQKAKQENGITNYEDIFFYQDIFKRIENLGDDIVKLKKNKISKNESSVLNRFIDIIYDLLIKKQDIDSLRSRLDSIRIPKNDEKNRKVMEKMHEHCTDIFEDALSIEFNKSYF